MTTKADIVALLKTNDKAVARALVVLNERQTQDEQASENTKYHNGRGFRPCHARMGTSMAKFFLARGYLSPKQVAYFRKTDRSGKMRIEIYAGQLLEVAEAKAAQKAVAATAICTGPMHAVEPTPTPYADQISMALAAAKAMVGEVVADDTRTGEQIERDMQLMEAQGDREQTAREEAAKFAARQAMEKRPVSSWDAIFKGVKV